MRLGLGLQTVSDDPEKIARAYVKAGYSAAVCPPVTIDQVERIRDIRDAFRKQDVLLAEIGTWNNMLHPDLAIRKTNVQANINTLALADEIGVRCCVNIAGSFDPNRWDGPHPKNISEEAFEITIDNVKKILHAVKPKRSFYALETMPWVIPDSIASYQRLLQAIDHPQFAVHLDPVNMINSPERFYNNTAFLKECFRNLGDKIVSVHAKDIRMEPRLTIHLLEVRPGLGELDYRTFLREMNRLHLDTPLLLEHLPQDEYPLAQGYILNVAEEIGVSIHKARF